MVSEFTYKYGQGFRKDLEALLKWFRKENSVDFDYEDLATEVIKILKYNKQKILFLDEHGKTIDEFDSVNHFASWFNKWDETYTIEIKEVKD